MGIYGTKTASRYLIQFGGSEIYPGTEAIDLFPFLCGTYLPDPCIDTVSAPFETLFYELFLEFIGPLVDTFIDIVS